MGDFSGLVDSTKRAVFSNAKVAFTPSELDHLVKDVFKAFEVVSFLDWVIGLCLGRLREWTCCLRIKSTTCWACYRVLTGQLEMAPFSWLQ